MEVIFLIAVVAIVIWLYYMAWEMAKLRNRNPWLFLALGLVTNPLVSIILLAIIGDKEVNKL